MRILILGVCLLISAAEVALSAATDQLALTVQLPTDPVPLGDTFRWNVLLVNRSDAVVPVVPIFFFGRGLLKAELRSPAGEILQGPSGSADFWPEKLREQHRTMQPGEIIGAEFLVAPTLAGSKDYWTGLDVGCYAVSVVLDLHSFSEEVNWDGLEPPIKAALRSEEKSVCFSTPAEASLRANLSKLASGEDAKVVEAFLYFSNVADSRAAELLRSAIGDPKGWPNRSIDPYSAIQALRRQKDPKNLPFLREALKTRFREVAEQAIRDLDPVRRSG